MLYNPHLITEEELANVVHEAGGRMTPEEPFTSRISHETSHVWITVEPLTEGMFNEEGLALLEQVRVRLGGEPLQTCLSISVSRTPGSQRLAVQFASVCCQHWPCAVDDSYGKLFFPEDIERLYREDGGFTGYGL